MYKCNNFDGLGTADTAAPLYTKKQVVDGGEQERSPRGQAKSLSEETQTNQEFRYLATITSRMFE